MAAVISEASGDPSPFRNQHSLQSSLHYQTAASRPCEHTPRQPSGSISRRYREDASAIPRNQKLATWEPSNAADTVVASPVHTTPAAASTAQRPAQLPSPPSSNKKDTPPTSPQSSFQNDSQNCMDPPALPDVATQSPETSSATTAATRPAVQVIKVRDLGHIQSLAQAECARTMGTGILDVHSSTTPVRYDISEMPIADIIEMVAGLLSKMTTANDVAHDAKQRNVAHQQQAMGAGDAANASPLSTSVLAFHGKNVPAIGIHSYLARIHKYCPTTFEVFLSLLVYFDRMTERINRMVSRAERKQQQRAARPRPEDAEMRDAAVIVDDSSDLADDDSGDDDARPPSQGFAADPRLSAATFFVVDNYNVHRLVIAGVTCASKFFSDIFYTNSRYAKVGGLPLPELNHLEIQFLALNEFRLNVDVETLESYATTLVEFYARESAVGCA